MQQLGVFQNFANYAFRLISIYSLFLALCSNIFNKISAEQRGFRFVGYLAKLEYIGHIPSEDYFHIFLDRFPQLHVPTISLWVDETFGRTKQ